MSRPLPKVNTPPSFVPHVTHIFIPSRFKSLFSTHSNLFVPHKIQCQALNTIFQEEVAYLRAGGSYLSPATSILGTSDSELLNVI